MPQWWHRGSAICTRWPMFESPVVYRWYGASIDQGAEGGVGNKISLEWPPSHWIRCGCPLPSLKPIAP
jgi:hypothetical protein